MPKLNPALVYVIRIPAALFNSTISDGTKVAIPALIVSQIKPLLLGSEIELSTTQSLNEITLTLDSKH
ncbi:MAG: hypothetical protein A3E37_04380 [Candidatus Andersenbacteria bacterium RIFCSPHIGHO2_12_FULL_46_9]|nr:MAG: hypothetical protein A3B76_00460 [Candidatus Andersenbacteria bacterium RIFCSPHIGHO2_02_FULL_46_16]OGY36093.1 MAG: hypothetical protein A3E37_04380 [Candidatus Andersenbacteria bacterium RIFCSPHIGHO2_12_FULL_46_9]OGY39542.1 MAG: hypothetical protein A3G57_01255 [Candidatus Andersenbacteria bacterium RIFCSPLOWO2_12_FULL_45_8]HBE89635.1 hypothetical protein [Candidatus Andersenbacteria bacterium]